MSVSKEHDLRLDMLRSLLAKGEPIWGQMAPEVRPDVDRVAQTLTIGKIVPSKLSIHPGLPLHMREAIEANMRDSNLLDISNRITYTDGISGSTTITERALVLSEASLTRIMYCHAAADRLLRIKRKSPRQFSFVERGSIAEMVDGFRHVGVTFRPDGIVNLGFRKIVMEGDYAIAEIEDPATTDALNDLFPTAMEIITEEVGFHGGKVRSFVEKLKQGIVGISPVEDHPGFAITLFGVMRAMEKKKQGGWQDLLVALGSGEHKMVLKRLNPYTGNSKSTAMLLVELQAAYRTDEEAMYRAYAQKN